MNLKDVAQDISAEQACLGSCLIDKNAFITAVETLRPNDFYKEEHILIYQVMLKMLQQNINVDLVTLTAKLKEDNNFETVGGVIYLLHLVNSVPTSKNIENYIALIQKTALKRAQYKVLCDVESGNVEIESGLAKLEEIGSMKVKEETFQVVLENTLLNTLRGTEWNFGIQSFNKYLGGLDKGELMTIGGYTSQGKSDLAIQIAINQAIKGHGVLFLSTEMLPAEIGRRILGNVTSVKVMDLRKGMLTESERERLEDKAKEIGTKWNMNIKKIYSIDDVRKYTRKYEPELLFVDYIQNLSGDTDYKTATRNIKELQAITMQHELGTICVSQLNRNNQEVREPRLSDLRDTGRIEECSNMVAFMYWEDRLKQVNIQRAGGEPPEEPVVLILKNRDGTIGRFPVHFYPEYARIDDVMTGDEDGQQAMDDYYKEQR